MRAMTLVLVVGAGCGKSHPDPPPQGEIDRGKRVTEALAPATFDHDVKYLIDHPDVDQRLSFPVQKATATCGEERIDVLYNPYQDLLGVGVASTDAYAEEIQAVAFDGKPTWTNPKKRKADGDAIALGDKKVIVVGDRPPIDKAAQDSLVLVREASKAWAPDTDVAFEVQVKTVATKLVGKNGFAYEPREHAHWKVRLHAFSPAMTKEIVDQAAHVKHASATLRVLEGKAGDVEQLRHYEDAQFAPPIARYDQLKTEATKELEAAKTIPHAKYASSLAVEHDPACAK